MAVEEARQSRSQFPFQIIIKTGSGHHVPSPHALILSSLCSIETVDECSLSLDAVRHNHEVVPVFKPYQVLFPPQNPLSSRLIGLK